ncbi:hypothetical protein IWW35_003710 [Coemansia sp. RSA 1878]|nr:hypothetical protein IWW35_003710 [Coemansia sp. RSA 1878]
MDGASPAAAAIIERVISYLDKKTVRACETLNKTWYTLVTVRSVRNIDTHILQLPLRIAHCKRKGLLGSARALTIDVSFVDGFLSPAAYERRVREAAMLVRKVPGIRTLSVHAMGLHSAPSNDEIHSGVMAVDCLLRALPQLSTLDMSECPVALLDPSGASLDGLTQLRHIRWFTLGRNDMTSAAALTRLVSSNTQTIEAVDGQADITDNVLRQLCDARKFRRLNARGSNISDDSLQMLVRARGSQLTELVLSDCTRLTRRSIGHLTPEHLPRLQVLDLYNVVVTTDTYQALFNRQMYWPYLRDLKLKAALLHVSQQRDERVNDDILVAIGQNCPRLVALRLFGCHGITDAGLSAILGNLGDLRELVVMHHAEDPVSGAEESEAEVSETVTSAPEPNGLLLSLPSINDIWATIPSLPANAVPHRAPPPSAPSTPCLSSQPRRGFTSQALQHGVRSRRFNLLNLDMAYDSVCAEHLAQLSHLQVLCGRVITRHAKSLLESQFPKCKMMVWNID